MNLSHKLDRLQQHVDAIARHTDESKAVRAAVLQEAADSILKRRAAVLEEPDRVSADEPAAA